MRYLKPALTYDAQLAKLLDRGLIVDDPDRATTWLRRIGYYRLSGYLYPFRISPSDDRFRPGSRFAAAVSVYKFDCHLRLLLMQAIDRVEIAIRASATYHFAHEFGPFGHLDQNNYLPYVPARPGTPGTGFDFANFGRIIRRDEGQSHETFLAHYRENYDEEPELPIWMLTEIISFGTLSKMIENVSKGLRKKIGGDFGLSQSQVASWLRTLYYVRNLCAHHSRLWNREMSVKPELLREWKAVGVSRERVYCVLLMFTHLMTEIAPKARWKDRLMVHILDRPTEANLGAMHIPENWIERVPWKSSPL